MVIRLRKPPEPAVKSVVETQSHFGSQGTGAPSDEVETTAGEGGLFSPLEPAEVDTETEGTPPPARSSTQDETAGEEGDAKAFHNTTPLDHTVHLSAGHNRQKQKEKKKT